ncbi:MAG: hypothetical protein U0807_08830 [Candidatus Binatia bacterium]
MTIAIVLAAIVVGVPDLARALNFFELEVYPATTEGKGLHEIENLSTFVAKGRDAGDPADEDEGRRHHLFRSSLEYNYGLTDKIDLAAYVDFEKPNGEDVEYAGSRVRARGALWEKGRFPVDIGWYLEAEMPHAAESDLELEFRPLVSRDFGRFSIDVNPAFELPTVSEERRTLEFNYAARVAYRLTPQFTPAVEFYGGLGQIRDVEPSREQEHYVFALAYLRLPGGFHVNIGPGFGLTRGSDPVIVKANLEYEFTLGGGR